MTDKKKRYLEWGMFFWIGAGLMSIINVWKITANQNAVRYSWIMFGVSIILVITCVIMILVNKQSSGSKKKHPGN